MRFVDWSNLRLRLGWIYRASPVVAQGVVSSPSGMLSAWLLYRGEVKVRNKGEYLRAKAGQWVFPPLGNIDREFSPDAEILSIHFQANWPTGHQLFEESEPRACLAESFPDLKRTGEAMLNVVNRRFPYAYITLAEEELPIEAYLKIQRGIPDWITAYYRAMVELGAQPLQLEQADSRVYTLMEWLNTHSLSEPLSLERLAQRLSLGAHRIERLFLKEFNLTPRAYLEKRRLDQAKRLLQSDTAPVKEIAYGLGFKQVSHFSNWFKKQTTYSPRAFRQRGYSPEETTF